MEGRQGGWREGKEEGTEESSGRGWPGAAEGWWLGRKKWRLARERGSRPRFYLDFFMNSSSGSCTERTEAGIDQEKEESPQP